MTKVRLTLAGVALLVVIGLIITAQGGLDPGDDPDKPLGVGREKTDDRVYVAVASLCHEIDRATERETGRSICFRKDSVKFVLSVDGTPVRRDRVARPDWHQAVRVRRGGTAQLVIDQINARFMACWFERNNRQVPGTYVQTLSPGVIRCTLPATAT